MKGLKAGILRTGVGTLDSNLILAHSRQLTHDHPHVKLEFCETPFYCILIQHPEVGNILYDTGARPDANEYWPYHISNTDRYAGGPDSSLEAQLALAGLTPKDIHYVIVSHMHMDHIDNIHLFQDTAEFFVHEEEMKFACLSVCRSTNPVDHGWYIREEVLAPVKKWNYITQDQEIFPGITAIHLPGHTPGTMGLILELESGNVICVADAIYNSTSYKGVLPGIIRDPISHLESLQKVKRLQKQYRAEVWFGHDPDQINAMKVLPEMY